MFHSRLGIALAAALTFAVPRVARAAGALIVTGAGDPMVWPGPVPYNPDQGTLGSLSNAAAVALVAGRFATWQAVPSANISYTNAGALPVDVTVANYPTYLGVCGDGLSPIIIDSNGSITDDVFGVGASDDVLGFAGPECGTYVPPVIDEGVAVLNGKFIDGVPGTEIPLADFEAVFLHEFGHYVNLDHSQINLTEAFDGVPGNDDAIATMFPFLINGSQAATLSLDDIVSISTLYPNASFATDFGTLNGTVYRSNGTTMFQGAYVIARAVGDPRVTAVGVASGARYFPAVFGGPPAAALEGAYSIPGLPPGSYTIEVEAIDPLFSGGSSVGPLDPPVPLPGVPEFYNGANESGSEPPDDPSIATPVAAVAGSATSALDIVLNAPPPAPNDACVSATVIQSLPYSDSIDTAGAITDPTDPLQACSTGGPAQNSASVWYVLTAPADGVIHADTMGSDYDTVLTAHTGACGALVERACNDDSSGLQSDVTFSVTAGETILLEVTSYGVSVGGALAITVDFASVTDYPGTYTDLIGDTLGAGPVQTDLASVSVCHTASDLVVSLAFATPISPGTSGNADAIGGFVDLDTDQNAGTGVTPNTDLFTGATTGLGMDYVVDLFSSTAAGSIDVGDANGFFVGTGTVSFGVQGMAITIPLSLLGGDDGNASLAAVVGTSIEPTDGAPPDGHVTAVPCAGAPTCGTTPQAGCRQPTQSQKALLKLANKTPDTGDALQWKWTKGAATAKADFGDPLGPIGGFTLCLYDEIAGTPTLVQQAQIPFGGLCSGKPCWKESGTGFKYKSKTNADGIQSVGLKAGVAGKPTITVKGKGTNVAVPALPLSQNPTVTVQLLGGAGNVCWDSSFGAPAGKNLATTFVDKSD
jgi:hypothetical protein